MNVNSWATLSAYLTPYCCLSMFTLLEALGSKLKSDLTFTVLLLKVLTAHHSSPATMTKDGRVHAEGTHNLEGTFQKVLAATERSICTQ